MWALFSTSMNAGWEEWEDEIVEYLWRYKCTFNHTAFRVFLAAFRVTCAAIYYVFAAFRAIYTVAYRVFTAFRIICATIRHVFTTFRMV